GIGVMLLPGEVMLMFPMIVRPLLGNGLIVGISTAILMEHLVLRKKNAYAAEKKADAKRAGDKIDAVNRRI
ncbi:MAG: hypothetical protein ACOYBM_05640, partial [Dethiobacteria bacterium]